MRSRSHALTHPKRFVIPEGIDVLIRTGVRRTPPGEATQIPGCSSAAGRSAVGRRRPACHNDPPGAMRPSSKVPHQMLRQLIHFQPLFPLLLNVRVRDLPVQRLREFAGHTIHVLRLRTGELVDPAEVLRRVAENGSDYLSHISTRNRRSLAPPERQFDAVSVADALSG
jgi:hypothetical protein